MTTFDEWNTKNVKKFTITLTNDEGNSMQFIFKKNPSIGTYERIMNSDEKGSQAVALIAGLLMKPVLHIKSIRNLDGRYLEQILEGIVENINLPENIKEKIDDTIGQRNESTDDGLPNEGTESAT